MPKGGTTRSVANQSVAGLGAHGSVLNRQRRDHIKLDRLLDRLGELSAADQDPVLLAIYRLVFPHAFAEEAVLWPLIRRGLPDGHDLTLRVEQEHQEINELVSRLELLQPDSPERQELLRRVVRLLREDVRDEEDVLLARLQPKLRVGQLRAAGVAWVAVRWIVPTRAHPIVARRPPGNVRGATAGDPGSVPGCAGPRGLSRRSSRARPGKTGRGIVDVSHAVERLPGMGSGEGRSTRANRTGPSRSQVMAMATIALVPAAFALARRGRIGATGSTQRRSGGPMAVVQG